MSLRSFSTSELRHEIERREKGATRLSRKREKLARQLAALEAEMAGLGVVPGPRRGRPPGRPAGRARNESSLLDVIVKVVKAGSTVSPADVASRVRKAGYKSTSAHFGMMVSNALSKDKRFKRVSRGQYQKLN
jgi:hypothetical protein